MAELTSNHAAIFSNVPETAAVRHTVAKGQVLRLSTNAGKVRVLSGSAWITQNGEDYVLTIGEQAWFSRRHGDPILVTVLGIEALTLELTQ